MKYNIDLECLSVQEYKALLKKQNLLPGRRILWQDIDNNFALFECQGIKTVAQLKKFLSTPVKIKAFADNTGIPENYFVILKREIGSLEQKPVPLASFPGIDPLLIEKLNEKGLKTSKDYFEHKQSMSDELFCLCDLIRINGVGPVAAKAFYEAGYRCVPDVAGADASAMLGKVSEVNRIRRYYKVTLGLKDMQFCIDFASLLEEHTS
ncbi:MAG: helix-hairpin-helix domain-containing protein [Eubacteriales bacterium]